MRWTHSPYHPIEARRDIILQETIMVKEIDLIPSELSAIETHKYYLSEREGREVGFEEAMIDFINNCEADFFAGNKLKTTRSSVRKYRNTNGLNLRRKVMTSAVQRPRWNGLKNMVASGGKSENHLRKMDLLSRL